MSWRRDGRWLLTLLAGAVVVLLLTGRALAVTPPPQALSSRELLALSPQAVSELPLPEQAKARARLAQALAAQASAGLQPMLLPTDARLAPAVQLPLSPGLQKVLALDLQRRARKQEPVLVGVLLQAALKPLPAAGLLDTPEAAGERSARLLLPGGLTPNAAVSLRRLCERAAVSWPTLLEGATVRLVAGMPFAVLLAQPERVIYVNPVALALLAPPVSAGGATAAATLPLDGERLLTYRSVQDCVRKVKAGCVACTRGDAAECAAVRSTLAIECREIDGPTVKLDDLCSERALALRSVADCVSRSKSDCLQTPRPAHCRDTVDRCIKNPDTRAPASGSGSTVDEAPPIGASCTACSVCGQGCATSCGECTRQACEPLGEPCSNKLGQTCTESCNDFNSECNQGCGSSCTQAQRDCSSNCSSFNSFCSSCSRSCGQCNSGCSQCSRDCNQCNSDCNQCNSDCASCGSQCNQCNSDCASCNSQCNQCNSGCPNPNQCSVSGAGGGYPRFPLPPGPAAPPSPLANMLVGARGAIAFCLPPLLFLWWRRRLYTKRRRSGATA